MQRSRRLLLRWAAGFAALSGSFGRARSQTYPTRPIRLVIPFPPGGAYDAVGRPLAEKLTALLGTLVVENIGGAGASLGAAAVAHAQPDGYTLLLGGTLPHVNEALLKSRPLYDPVRDLAPIASVAVNSLCIAIHPSLPARTLNELIAYAKASPGKLFKAAAGGLDIVPVPYRGTGPLLADLVGGQVQMGTPGVTRQAIEFHRSGRLRILAVTSAARLVAAPELPTAAELGFPDLVVRGSIGLLAPAGTPKAIVEQLAQAAHAAVADPAFQQLLVDAGIEPTPDSSPEKFRRSLASDVALWAPIVKAIGVKID